MHRQHFTQNHSRKMHWVFTLSLLLNLGVIAGTVAIIYTKGGYPWVEKKATNFLLNHIQKRSPVSYAAIRENIFSQLSIGRKDIVFIGDSILDYGEWHELLNNIHAKNRAIAGNNLHALLNRIDPIVAGNAEHYILEIGINDFIYGKSLKQTKIEYKQIVKKLLSGSIHSHIWLLPIFPVNQRLYQKHFLPSHDSAFVPNQADINDMNKFISNLAIQSGERIEFIPAPSLLNASASLRAEVTQDGVHLNGYGLLLIAKELRKVLY